MLLPIVLPPLPFTLPEIVDDPDSATCADMRGQLDQVSSLCRMKCAEDASFRLVIDKHLPAMNALIDKVAQAIGCFAVDPVEEYAQQLFSENLQITVLILTDASLTPFPEKYWEKPDQEVRVEISPDITVRVPVVLPVADRMDTVEEIKRQVHVERAITIAMAIQDMRIRTPARLDATMQHWSGRIMVILTPVSSGAPHYINFIHPCLT